MLKGKAVQARQLLGVKDTHIARTYCWVDRRLQFQQPNVHLAVRQIVIGTHLSSHHRTSWLTCPITVPIRSSVWVRGEKPAQILPALAHGVLHGQQALRGRAMACL